MSGFPTSGSGLSKFSEKEEFFAKHRESFAKKHPSRDAKKCICFLSLLLHCGSIGISSLEPGLTQAEDQAADLFEHGEGQQHTKNLALSKGFQKPCPFQRLSPA